MNKTDAYAFRLRAGEDLKRGIEAAVSANNIRAGWILSAVGSLTNYNLRFANQSAGSIGSGHFEIVSITGTLALSGCHIHISISDETGRTIGGHLLEGCKVYTTAEIVIAATEKYEFARELDEMTGWKELVVRKL